MKKKLVHENWVIYRVTAHGKLIGCVVCEKTDWEQLETENPGHQPLVQTGIRSESEAEWLARGYNTPPPVPASRKAKK